MAFVTPRMSLKVWNAASDPYDHEQLADNFLKLDQHDHSPGRGTLVGGDGIQPGAITSTHIYPGALGPDALGTGSITEDKVANGAITDAKLASPNNSVWRTVSLASAAMNNQAPATYLMFIAGSTIASGVTVGSTPAMFVYEDADYIVAGRTTQFRLLAGVTTNATAWGTITWTVGMRPLSTTGGTASGQVIYTAGSLVTGSDIGIVNPAINLNTTLVSNSFSLTTANRYLFTVVPSTTGPVNTAIHVACYLQMRHV